MNEHLRRAIDALEQGATDLRRLSTNSSGQVRIRLRETVDQVLEHLEADAAADPDGDDIMSHLDRQSREIAEDLRRIERLMKRRNGQD